MIWLYATYLRHMKKISDSCNLQKLMFYLTCVYVIFCTCITHIFSFIAQLDQVQPNLHSLHCSCYTYKTAFEEYIPCYRADQLLLEPLLISMIVVQATAPDSSDRNPPNTNSHTRWGSIQRVLMEWPNRLSQESGMGTWTHELNRNTVIYKLLI